MVPAARTHESYENSTNRQIMGASGRVGSLVVAISDSECTDADALSREHNLSEQLR
jgi:hypothetical protein